jgi:FMN reductase
MSTRTFAVVTAGLGQPSSTRLLADRLVTAASTEIGEHGDEARVQVVELREHAHDLANNLLAGFPSPRLGEAIDTVTGADGLVAVTPIFTASYSGLFKMFFDVLDDGVLGGKPVLIAATAGTPRHALVLEHAMRPLFAYLHAVVVPTAVFAAAEDWGAGDTAGDALTSRVDRAAHEFAALVCGAGSHTRAPDPFEDPTPFEQLLDGM